MLKTGTSEYYVNTYAGIMPLGNIVLELLGPNEDGIKAIHLRLTFKILELCEKTVSNRTVLNH